MAARKLAQEVDKCFKKVQEGVAEFESIYEKIEQSTNPAQKEKLEDNLKREIKKLQRLRDQIKTWAASNDIKDKGPLLEYRKLIETQMEKFKAVEKAMKTKAYSKEGLSAATKLDPKEQAKAAASDFLCGQIEELEQQVETLEAEAEGIQATVKKGKISGSKADRITAIEHIIERHKWHMSKLELIRRSLENGGVEAEQVTELEENIRYYVQEAMQEDFMEDDSIYDDLNLDEEEEQFGIAQENDKVSSQDTQSIQEEAAEFETRPLTAGKQKAVADATVPAARRPASTQVPTQVKSPLPALATLHNPLPAATSSSGASSGNNHNHHANGALKLASLPTRPPGEGLKYASAAASGASNVGIAPLPPPPSSTPTVGISTLPPAQLKTSAASSPNTIPVQLAAQHTAALDDSSTPVSQPPTSAPTAVAPAPGLPNKNDMSRSLLVRGNKLTGTIEPLRSPPINDVTNGFESAEKEKEEESIYHLPSSLQDLLESYEESKKRPIAPVSDTWVKMQTLSAQSKSDFGGLEPPLHYRAEVPYHSGSQYPQEPLRIFEDQALYSRIEPDTLFYVFYYKQGTYQQYFAAKALKEQSWRFHKQYQTWFQRHEEPKSITDDFEQGTYRFFDYESTWMNRRKGDFKFVYKFLEDEL